MAEKIPSRLLDQRARNRVIEALEVLADGVHGLVAEGWVEYVNGFFDQIDDDDLHDWRRRSTYTAVEIAQLEAVLSIMLQALSGTRGLTTDDEIAASGWPGRVQPIAREALTTMLERGRFDEEREEQEPSQH